MRSDAALCLCAARFHGTEHRSNAYFHGALIRYQSPDLGIRDWVSGLEAALRLTADPFTRLEWRKTLHSALVAAPQIPLAALLRQSFEAHRMVAAADLNAVATGAIAAFTRHLEYAPLDPRILHKLNTHLGLSLSERRIRDVPELLFALRDLPRALLVAGPPDLIRASLEALGLPRHAEPIVTVSGADLESDATLEALAASLGVSPERLFVVNSHRWSWARTTPRSRG